MPALDNQKHERFCQLVATDGKSDLLAYQEAMQCSYDAAQSSAYRLRENVGVVERIRELQTLAASGKVLSLAEKREFLASVVRTPVGEVTEKSPLCQSFKLTDDTIEYKMVDKLTALKLDAQLAKELGDGSQGTDLHVSVYSLSLNSDPD